jgi:ribosomal protein S18 acetylase RimI-like enzyme
MIIKAKTDYAEALSPLIAAFRQELQAFKGKHGSPDLSSAKDEFMEYMDKGYPVYCYLEDSLPLGYAVCRVADDVVWCESLYVLPQARRRGIATALFRQAEALASSLGEPFVYNNVHPNNHSMIAFLKKLGYDVLNLIEIRKACPSESLQNGFIVGEHIFRY